MCICGRTAFLTRRPEFPDFSRRGAPTHRILAFGKWGTYKRLELMIVAFELICGKLPEVKLVIAGGDHPQAAGYVGVDQATMRGESSYRVLRLRSGRCASRSLSDFHRRGYAVLFFDWMQRRCASGLRVWSAHRLRGSGGLSADGPGRRIGYGFLSRGKRARASPTV